MNQLPYLPDDEDETAPRTKLGRGAVIGLVLVVIVVATTIVLHLTGVIAPGGH